MSPKTMPFAATMAILAACAAGTSLLHGSLLQEQERLARPQARVAKPAAAGQNRVVIAPATESLADGQSVLQKLLPYTTPPGSAVVVLNDGSAVTVEGLEWAEGPGSNPKPQGYIKCACQCITGKVFICGAPDGMSYEKCCDRCCKMRLEGPRPMPMPYDRTASPGPRAAEVDASLAALGLRRATAGRKAYPIDLVLLGSNPQPEQIFICMRKDAQGQCIHWRICGTNNEGVYKCYDIVKDPAFGWVVTW